MDFNLLNDDGYDEAARIAMAREFLTRRGYRITSPPKPHEELPGQIKITDYDPVTGELISTRFITPRSRQDP